MLRVAVRIGVQSVPGVLEGGGFRIVGCGDGDGFRFLRRVGGDVFGGRLAVEDFRADADDSCPVAGGHYVGRHVRFRHHEGGGLGMQETR